MVRKRVDERIRSLIERGVYSGQRSLFVLIGDHGKDQVPNLFHLLSCTTVAKTRSKVLWLYKKELGFSSHKKKRMKKLKRDKSRGLVDENNADNFELFLTSNEVEYMYYKDSHRALGSTVGMLVLQDFEALTPNLLARTIECVEGGGIVVLLLRTVKSLKQVYTMTMDVHNRYRTESQGDVVPRFNERFILSLTKNPNCLVCDDELNILPSITKATIASFSERKEILKGDAGDVIVRSDKEEQELENLKNSLADTPNIGELIKIAKTLDQARAVLTFLESISDFNFSAAKTVALTAARGRGKSAAIGLCLAGAISFGFGTIALTAPEPENLVSVFDFIVRGLNALKYQEHLDYTITYNTEKAGRESRKCIIGITLNNVNNQQQRRQTIRYIPVTNEATFASAEILAIDEAAAIPLPIVRQLTTQGGARLTFLSSTVNGYEGTGRALSLKLIAELRNASLRSLTNDANASAEEISGVGKKKGEFKVHEQRWQKAAESSKNGYRNLVELELTTPIRYSSNDPVEAWLNKLLCMTADTSAERLANGTPSPENTSLYIVNREALFSFHKLSEKFLQKVMTLYSSAHYKNSPNDLQLLSDAPAHNLFVLLGDNHEGSNSDDLPDILAVLQVALEGKISRKQVEAQLMRGQRSAGDLIPWTLSQQFGDSNFAQLSGARVVRIAVHPSVQGMGYGGRAIELLHRYYNGEIINLGNDSEESDDESAPDKYPDENEEIVPRKDVPPLLVPLESEPPPRLDWLGTSFGLTEKLYKFWSFKAGMRLLYLRQTSNELTGEYSAIFVKSLPRRSGFDDGWLYAFEADVKRRLVSLLGGPFAKLPVSLATSLLISDTNDEIDFSDDVTSAIAKRSGNVTSKDSSPILTVAEISQYLTPHDLARVELYSRNLCDYHLITDLLPTLGRLFFLGKLESISLSQLQSAILCGTALQFKSIDVICSEFPTTAPNQILALFHKAIRKLSLSINSILNADAMRAYDTNDDILDKLQNVTHQTLDEDANEGADLVDVKSAMGMDTTPNSSSNKRKMKDDSSVGTPSESKVKKKKQSTNKKKKKNKLNS